MSCMPDQPNLLIIMTDQQRADTLDPSNPAPMPHLRNFLGGAVQFTEAYSPTAHCCPSRASFFTGLFPSQHGVWNNVCNDQRLSRGLGEGVSLWNEALGRAGYDCFFTGKWHLSADENPVDRGWREGRHVSARCDAQMGLTWSDYRKPGFAFSGECPTGCIRQPGYNPGGVNPLFGSRETDPTIDHDRAVAAEMAGFLEESAAADSPWCAFAGLLGPHDPYVVPQRFLDAVDPEAIELPGNWDDRMEDRPHYYARLREHFQQSLGETGTREALRHYLAFCSFVDEQVGLILDALDASGQAEETIVVFCSDHGDYAGEHGLFCKGIPAFRSATHVPLAIRVPGVKGQRPVDALVSLADIGPTLLDLAGVHGAPMAGRSLAPFLHGERPPDWRTALCTQMEGTEIRFSQRSIRKRDWLYVYNPSALDELYDLRTDPGETRNLADEPSMRPVLEALCRELWRQLSQLDDPLINGYYTVALAPVGPGDIGSR